MTAARSNSSLVIQLNPHLVIRRDALLELLHYFCRLLRVASLKVIPLLLVGLVNNQLFLVNKAVSHVGSGAGLVE